MRYVYPVELVRDEDGQYVISSPDVPEALTEGSTPIEALHAMGEALGAALAGYVIEGRDIPAPSPVRADQHTAPVAPLVAAKLALHAAMREQDLSKVALAERLGVSEGVVRRLLNPDHASRLDRVVSALAVLGRGLAIEDLNQAA
ncbi:MAG: type II toxin-antitoxin system HicB family antitoxin [Wenzhouxiangellaceae bacterium]|nr:type II toxin-antitoxin system HicB family antitoxin [Wenzhouxiangellaceae bacterium]